ncbi:Golgi apparatus membrane protein tvp18 [Cytospora paraplurivora]|uniref:Golgi apparatus membrane protein tvp18 n=1 Tax=Cytospora paraplurivora TaxID=2898453 RepID=A0AAN9UIW7_9PEZI
MALYDEFATRNFNKEEEAVSLLSVNESATKPTGFQLTVGRRSMDPCDDAGIANIFIFDVVIIIFSAILLVCAFIIVFVEVPLLLRICPTSSTFDAYIRKISTNYMRAAAYGVMAVIQWLSIIRRPTSLIAEAIVLTFTGLCYLLAAIKGQEFVGSKTLGGQGVAAMMV